MSANMTSHRHEKKSIALSMTVQLALVLIMVGVVLYAVLFTTYPPVHDFFHELRHSMLLIPCH